MGSSKEFYYSPKYTDDEYEYRHVHCPKDVAKNIPKNRLLTEPEWRSLGIQQSVGWVHYMIHTPERHVLLFRRRREPQVGFESSMQQYGMSTTVRVGD